MNISITISNKIATITSPTYAVCDNTDYAVVFTFDSEWTPYTTKTARFAYNGGHYDAVFTGNTVTMPKIENADMVLIGVFAGDLHTTTPAKLPMVRSILHSKGGVICPTDRAYDQILEMVRHKITEPTTEGTSGQVLTTDGNGGRSWTTCEGTTDHSQLDHLAYAESGHTGFQPTIDDLATIRSGAALGATALQSVPDTYRTSAAQDVIDSGKVDKVTGKGLSTEDYTTAEKTKLAGVESGADVTKAVMTSTTATAWTDSEKAAARARIGSDEVVELMNLTTTESIVFQLNNMSLYKRIIVFTKAPILTADSPAGYWIISDSNTYVWDRLFYAMAGTYCSSTRARLFTSDITITDDFLIADLMFRNDGGASSEYMANSPTRGFAVVRNGEVVLKSNAIPAGVSVMIWGVKK